VRFLADENLEAAVVQALRESGHDVLEVGTHRPGIDDDEVASLARRERRILVTHDKDFGELAFLQGRRLPGILLIRPPGRSGKAKAPIVLEAIRASGSRLVGRIVVVEPGRLRSRPLRIR